MAQKKLNETTITNDLKGASLFFKEPKRESPVPSQDPSTAPVASLAPSQTPQTVSIPLTTFSSAEDPLQATNVGQIAAEEYSRSHSNLPISTSQSETTHISDEMTERTNVRTNGSKNERRAERLNERKKTRHTFDIFADQLLSLKEIALERQILSGDRILLGDLVQEALDLFIAQEQNREETNAR